MRATTHLLGGQALGLAAVYLWGRGATPLLAGAALGSLLPDIDHPGSKLGRKVKPVSWTLEAVAGHRGPIHSLLLPALVAAVGFPLAVGSGFGIPFLIGVLLGIFSHFLLDAFNPTGLPLFFPFSSHRFSFPLTVKTGGVGELGFTLLCAVACALLAWKVWG